MDLEAVECSGLPCPRPRTFSNASQLSQQSSKQNFPLMTNDSGLYTCSSNTSDCSLQLESDTDSGHQSSKIRGVADERLQLALQDVRKLRSELERLTKSEQWYKQELRQQKNTRMEDFERIYTQERKFMHENQRLQKECVRLYEKCNELERELEKQQQEANEHHVVQHVFNEQDLEEENMLKFEKEQQLALIKDQQQLISVLRKQKRSLLEDLRCLTEEKDEKVMELQRLLADLEFDNKLMTKKCTQFAKERVHLENNLKQSASKLSASLQEKTNLQKSILDLRERLELQNELLKLKESKIEQIQQHYTHKIQHEQDLDQVHQLSIKYHVEINGKTLEIINLKERLQEMQDEMDNMQHLQQQNELQQRQIDQLNFSLETHRFELQELKTSEQRKNKQLEDLHTAMDQLINDKEEVFKTTVEQQNDFLRVKQALKSTQEQYEQVQELYKKTQFQLELLEIEKGKVEFQNERDQQEIEYLRNKLKEYLQQTADLSNKIQLLEQDLAKVLKENNKLKQHSEELMNIIQELEDNAENIKEQQIFLKEDLSVNELPSYVQNLQQSFIQPQEPNKSSDDKDFLELQQQCEKLQAKLDFIQDNQAHFENQEVLHTLHDLIAKIAQTPQEDKLFSRNSSTAKEYPEKDPDFINLSLQSNKLQENLEKLNRFLQEKHQLLIHLQNIKDTNEDMEKLVIENEILKKMLCGTETEAITLQIRQNINERTQKYIEMQESLENHKVKVKNLQEDLLENDAKLYKMERKLMTSEEVDAKLKDLQRENDKLKEELKQELESKTDLNKKLHEEREKLQELIETLEDLKLQPRATKNQATQCALEDGKQEKVEIKELQQQVLHLQQQQRNFLEQEAFKKEERLKLLQKMLNLQNNKMYNLQQHQEDWEEMLTSLKNANALEEKTRQEFELKRLELEELNQVFAEQNEELRKLEEFTVLLELKRQHEKEHLKLTFQQEINMMKQHLQDCQQEIEQQKLANQQLEKRNERFQQDINEDYAAEVAEYKKEIRQLKSTVCRITEEKEDLREQLKELVKNTKDLTDNKREAIFMADLSLVKVTDITQENHLEHNLQQNSEDHLRILTKVLEAEYQRKMQRYDEHIHSLLSSVKSLKKSLKVNEEKAAMLSEEQFKTKDELKELQRTKRNLEEMRLKYEQSQNTIKELKHTLAFERKKFELTDVGKSSQNNGTNTTYEVSNLIDDYKKIIQQSAEATKRPSTNAILELIQRSNQCVPNLQKLETNVDGLCSDLQNFLTSYNHKMPATSLIAAASLSVPPSLMDELRAASEGF